MVLLTLAALAGSRHDGKGDRPQRGRPPATVMGGRAACEAGCAALWGALGVESIGQRRYREECAEAQKETEPLWRRRWLVHALTIWGFLGLLAATIADYGLSLIGVKKVGAPVPIWYPVRLLGTIAGLSLVYGVSIFILNRLAKSNRAVKESKPSDWMFLVMLWVVGVTGFLIELSLYLPHPPSWGYWVFLFHVSVAMELMLLLPFIKFAHALYRPMALFFLALAKEGGGCQIVPDRNCTAARTSEGAAKGGQQSMAGTTKKTIIVFSGDMDKAFAAFIIANGAAAMGDDVTMFFTFWGLNVLRKPKKQKTSGKSFLQSMFGGDDAEGPEKLTLSNMNFAGAGPRLMKRVMKQQKVMSLDELIASAHEQGIKFEACTMSMDVMGIKAEELIDGLEFVGVASYLSEADEANVNLFI